MIPKNRTPVHPGEILQEEFLLPLRLTQVRLAAHIGVPVQRVNEIVRGKRGHLFLILEEVGRTICAIFVEKFFTLADLLGSVAQ